MNDGSAIEHQTVEASGAVAKVPHDSGYSGS